MRKKMFLLGSGVIIAMPLSAMAVVIENSQGGIFYILSRISAILAFIIPILVTLAVVYFIWGVIQYLISGNEEKKKKAKEMILSGLIGLFVIVAFWGIIRLITTTFGVGPEQLNESAIPCIENTAAGIHCN